MKMCVPDLFFGYVSLRKLTSAGCKSHSFCAAVTSKSTAASIKIAGVNPNSVEGYVKGGLRLMNFISCSFDNLFF